MNRNPANKFSCATYSINATINGVSVILIFNG